MPREYLDNIWNEINKIPNENDVEKNAPVNNWIGKGPAGMEIYNSAGSYNSGRILDMKVETNGTVRIAAATGGLWQYLSSVWTPLSESVTSLAVASFDSKPGDINTIYIGTGELSQRGGTGIWKTTNGGGLWTQLTTTPSISNVTKLRFDPTVANKIHAATDKGYFVTTNGTTWTRTFTGACTDLAINPVNSNIIYLSALDSSGIYKSVNGGLSFTKITVAPMPTTNVGRGAISIYPLNPSVVYVNLARADNNLTLGVYLTINDGASWSTITPPFDFHWGQGWYNCFISVSPVNPNFVYAGGGTLIRTTNAGATWNDYLSFNDPLYDPINIHADQHSCAWNSTGTTFYEGNDGGITFTNNGGTDFSTSINKLPITQYVNFDVSTRGNYIFGGSQDNGISGSTNWGNSWYFYIGGDGGGIAIDPVTPSKMVATNGVYGGSWAFRRLISTNSGIDWAFIDNGVVSSNQWYHKIRNDDSNPLSLYNHSGAYVYKSTNYGTNWTAMNATAFPVSTVSNLKVSKYTTGGAVVYAPLSSNATGTRLEVFDNGTWDERSSGLPSGVFVKVVTPHQTNANVAYCIMSGLASTQKVYKTTNRGALWTDISGNIPNIPVADIVPHPTNDNYLYLGTEMGCYKTTNGGAFWYRWNNGLPQAAIVTEMNYVDSTSINGKFYIFTGTYGRGIYMREISGDDNVGVSNNSNNIPDRYNLSQNYPNPFNPSTIINYSLLVNGFVTLKVYDILGSEVATLVNEFKNAGTYKTQFPNNKYINNELPSGIYFYKLTAGDFTDTKKMLMIK